MNERGMVALLHAVFGTTDVDSDHPLPVRRPNGAVFRRVLRTLSPREEQMVEWRFGLTDRGPLTLAEIGNQYALSPERVRQILVKALRKLSDPSRSKALRQCIDNAEGSRVIEMPRPD